MDAAHLVQNELVHVNSMHGTSRIITYVIAAPRGTGKVELNGGAANHFAVGEEVHVNCFASYDVHEDIPNPRVVETNDLNEITSIK